MESHSSGALDDIGAVTRPARSLDAVHDSYVAIASTAKGTEEQLKAFGAADRQVVEEQDVEAILLADTDLALAFHRCPGYLIVDYAGEHVQAIAEEALRPEPAL